MYTTLRNTVLSTLGLLLIAAPALAETGSTQRREEIAKLQTALDEAEARIDAINDRLAVEYRVMGHMKAMYLKTGEETFREAVNKIWTAVVALENELASVEARAEELRARIEYLTALENAEHEVP